MPRPLKADSLRTRRRILDGAAKLFAARGVDGVSVRDVCGEAGLSVAMVHHYFGSKDELYTAVVDAMYAELAELQSVLVAEVDGTSDLFGFLDGAVRATFRFAREHIAAIRIVTREAVDTGELPVARRERFLLPFLDTVAALVPGTPAQVRLAAQSLVFLVVRYALATPEELARIAGVRGTARALAEAERHLVETAYKVFMPPVATILKEGKK